MTPFLRWLALLVAIALSGCGTLGRGAASGKNARAGQCDYVATLVESDPATLDVVVRCSGRELTGFTIAEPAAAAHVTRVRTASGEALTSEGYRWELPDEDAPMAISYRVDLEGIANEVDHFDVAERIGRSLVSPVSTWLLRPEPLDDGVPVTLRVETPPGIQFATGLRRAGNGYALEAHEIRTATYAVFGKFDELHIDLPGRASLGRTRLDVAILDAPLDAPRQTFAAWIEASARAVGEFWGGFPVKRTLLVVLPVRGRDGVLFGKVLPESAPGIALLVGQHTPADRLHDDWVLVHELFHLGSPSFNGEGKWLDEGLATYFEPLIRARHGWKTEESVWAEFVRAMPQAVDRGQVGELEKASSFREIYWGGAIVVLLADIEARRRSSGAQGLEDGLRSVLASGGDASEVWTLDRVIQLIDSRYDAPLLAPLARAHAHREAPVDLDKLWRELGVSRASDGVVLDDSAPLARIRKMVVYGPSGAPRAKP
jgi:hypothetical protein